MHKQPSWNRRGSAVTPNGFFTVLRSTGWFSTFRLPEGFRYATGKSVTDPLHPVDVVSRNAISNPAAAAIPLQQPQVSFKQIESRPVTVRGVLCIAALAIAGTALTYAAIQWMMNSPRWVP